MPVYSCDSSGNGLFYWSANPGVPAYGGTQVTSHQDGTYEVNFDHGDGTDGSPAGSTQTYMAPDYADPGCVHAGGGVFVPAPIVPTVAHVTETFTSEDVQILAGGVSGAPLDYLITGAQQLEPLAVTATFDCTGAAGACIPTMIIESDAGAIVSRVPVSQQVPVGDTAEVTWAPFLDAGQAATAQSPLPFHQKIDPSELYYEGNTSAGTTMVTDAVVWQNSYLLIDGLNSYFTFMFYMGPQYALFEIILRVLKGPDYGIVSFYVASLLPDTTQPGWVNPQQLIQDYPASEPPTWFKMQQNTFYNAAVQRNLDWAQQLRIMGAIGVPFTAHGGDPDFGTFALNGGPGIYAFKAQVTSKDGLSAGYKFAVADIGVHRITGLGFM